MTSIPGDGKPPDRIRGGTAAFRRTNFALFMAGFSTFALLYCIQPLLPVFSAAFGVSPATSSLSLSFTTGALALMMLLSGSLADRIGRKPLMYLSLALSSALTVLAAFATDFHQLLILRLLIGVTLSGLPSIAMAYLGEEIDPRSLGRAMGLLIGGSAFGGMMGRTLTGALTDLGSWRLALGTIGLLSLAGAVAFRRSLPESRHFVPRRVSLAAQSAALSGHFAEPGLPWLFAMGFLLMGSFVTLYNYVGYRLTAPPYDLSQTVVGLLFSVYLVGIFASTWVGGLADRLGRRRMLWVAVTLFLIGVELSRAASLPVIMLGIATATFGFFGAHAIASSWVSRRALTAKAQAASLYLCAYYLGSSVIGWLGGLAWASFGWNGVIDMETVLLAVGLLISFRLGRLKPLSPRS